MLFIKKQNISDEIKFPLVTTSPNPPPDESTILSILSFSLFSLKSVFVFYV